MGNYFDLIAAINAAIKTNGEQGITGASLNAILRDMVAALGAGYQYVGVVTPDAAAPSTDYNAVYLGLTPGTYTNFGGTQVRGGQFGVFTFNGSWTYNIADIASGTFVRCDGEQELTEGEKENARNNIDAASKAEVNAKYTKPSGGIPKTDLAQAVQDSLDEVSQLGQEVNFNLGEYKSQLIEMSLGYIVCNGAAGTVVDLTPVSHSTYKYAIVSCNPGDVVYIQGKGGNSDRLYCFIDSENKVISSATALLEWTTHHKLIAPANTMKVIINDETAQGTSYYGETLEGTVAKLVSSEEKTLDDVEITTQIDIDDIPDVVARTGTSVEPNPQNGANFSTNANYDSYYFYTSKQMTAWVVDNGTAYIAITVVEGAGAFSNNIIPGTSSYRKRKSESNLPTQQNPLIIPAGSAVIFTATKQKVFPFAYLDSYSEFNGDTPLAPEHIEQVKDEIGGLMYCSKSASAVDIYFRISGEKYIHYPFEKRYKDYTSGQYPSFYDNWGIGKVALLSFAAGALTNDAYLFDEGEAELAVSVVSGQDTNKYVGGKAHGFENIVVNDSERDITILIDNQRVAEDGVVSLKEVSKVEILQHTSLFQAYTNTDPFADITKHWVFEDGKMACTTTLKVLRALTFNYTQFGMMCVLRRWGASTSNPYLTSRAIKENLPYKSWEVEDGWSSGLSSPDSSCRRIIEYGEKGLGFSMAITTETLKTGGGMFVSTNNQAYNKIYFDMARNYTPSVNDVLEATQTWEIF